MAQKEECVSSRQFSNKPFQWLENVDFAGSLTEVTANGNTNTPGIFMASISIMRLHATVLVTATASILGGRKSQHCGFAMLHQLE